VDDPEGASLLVLARAGGWSCEDSLMLTFSRSAVDAASADQRTEIGVLYAVLLAANAAVWTRAVIR
jgi:hypothetical protein